MVKFIDNNWIEVDITPQMIKRAQIKAKQMGALKNSIRKGSGNVCGFLGEEVFLEAFIEAESSNDFNHDIKVLNNLKVEVKTKDRTVLPQPFYECSVANFNATQDTHIYVFCSLLREKSSYRKGYILGYLSPKIYKEKAKFMRAGDFDPSNGMLFKADCYNLPISKLNDMKKFQYNLEQLKKSLTKE